MLGKEHPDTLKSMNSLADSFYMQGKYDEAEKMHRQTLELREKVLGKEHPDMLQSMNHLVNSLDMQNAEEAWRGEDDASIDTEVERKSAEKEASSHAQKHAQPCELILYAEEV